MLCYQKLFAFLLVFTIVLMVLYTTITQNEQLSLNQMTTKTLDGTFHTIKPITAVKPNPKIQIFSEPPPIAVELIKIFKPFRPKIFPGSALAVNLTKTLLNLRKLVLFSVNEINLRLKQSSLSCSQIWANPLDVQSFQVYQIQNESSKLLYTIDFMIQPGQFFLEAVLEKNINRDYLYHTGFEFGKQNELKLRYWKVSERPGDEMAWSCSNNENLYASYHQNLCLCEMVNSAKNHTFELAESRYQRNQTDIELFSWPPNSPMFLTNYLQFGTKKLYFHSPDTSHYCNSKLKMVIMISSAPTHFKHRELIRSTYGNKVELEKIGVGILFLFGKVKDQGLQANISSEIRHYKDIVQVDFLDSYHNLTLSHLMMYNWLYTFCNGNVPKWLLKADDDFLINVNLTLDIANANPDEALMGYPFCSTSPIRDPNSKYYTPKYMYGPDWYVCYLSGVSYLIQTKWIPKFLQASVTTPIIHMDDAYVTGLLTFEIGVCIVGLPTRFGYINDQSPCQLKQTMSSILYPTSLLEQWTNLNSPATNCEVDINLKVEAKRPLKNIDECIFSPR